MGYILVFSPKPYFCLCNLLPEPTQLSWLAYPRAHVSYLCDFLYKPLLVFEKQSGSGGRGKVLGQLVTLVPLDPLISRWTFHPALSPSHTLWGTRPFAISCSVPIPSPTGPWFWRLQPSGQLVSPRPARLHRFWEGLPPKVTVIQAAYTRHRDGRILLFSGEWGAPWVGQGAGAVAHQVPSLQAHSSGCSGTGC